MVQIISISGHIIDTVYRYSKGACEHVARTCSWFGGTVREMLTCKGKKKCLAFVWFMSVGKCNGIVRFS